jgi:hypothetical protein
MFDYSKQGLIPGVLTTWFAERKALQAEYRVYSELAGSGLEIDADLDNEVMKILAEDDQGDAV